MNQSETIRLTAEEIRILLTGTAYLMVPKTLAYNKNRVIEATLGSVPASALVTKVSHPQDENDGYESARSENLQSLANALNKVRTRCAESNANFDKILNLNVGLQTKLLAALGNNKAKNFSVDTLMFTKEETDFLLESATEYIFAEASLTSEFEIVMASVQYDSRNPNAAPLVTESTRQAKETVMQREEALIVLQAKLINYRDSQSSSNYTSNDQ